MRTPALLALLIALLWILPAAARASAASEWRDAVQTAPGRVVLPDGDVIARDGAAILVAGTTSDGNLVTAQLRDDGRLDGRYGADGVAFAPFAFTPTSIVALPDHRRLVFGLASDFKDVVVRLLADGTPDPGFGSGGAMTATDGQWTYSAPVLSPDGTIVVRASAPPGPVLTQTVARMRPDGSPDPGFDAGWLAQIPSSTGTSVMAFDVRSDGSIVALVSVGRPTGQMASYLVALTPAGALDRTFGGGAPVPVPISDAADVLVRATGEITVLVPGGPGIPSGNHGQLVHFTATGGLDRSKGSRGVTDLGVESVEQILAAPGGATLAIASGERIVRVARSGRVDTSVGARGGLAANLAFGGGKFHVNSVDRPTLRRSGFQSSTAILRPDGSLLFAGRVIGKLVGGGEEEETTLQEAAGTGLAALTRAFRPDRRFGGRSTLRASAALVGHRLTKNGIAVRVRASDAGFSAATLSVGHRTIAWTIVPLALLVPIPATDVGIQTDVGIERAVTQGYTTLSLTDAGKRLLRGRGRVTARLTTTTLDLAGNAATTTTIARIAR